MIERFSERSLRQKRRRLWWSHIAPFYLSHSVPLGIAGAALLSGWNLFESLFSGLVFTLLPTLILIANAPIFFALRKRGAARDWAVLTHAFLPRKERLENPTRQLKNKIAQIYRLDSQAQTFPLHQALALLDAHHRQQKRLVLLGARLWHLQKLSVELQQKITQLQKLGETSEDGQNSLRELQGEARRLGECHTQIQTSCARLELLLLQVEKAVQTRALRQDIAEISAKAQQKASAENAENSETDNLERQITREIETYLALEKQSDAVLREI